MSPDRWVESRVAEEFGCTLSVAERELDQHADAVLEVLALRAFARAKAVWDQVGPGTDEKAKAELLRDPWVKRVIEAEFSAARAEKEQDADG